jgi:tRNA(His) guanylyltransferase
MSAVQRTLAELAERMKAMERDFDQRLSNTKNVLIRLDGHAFTKFTKRCGFRRPFDHRIHVAMLATTADLFEEFRADAAYTESDEITLVLARTNFEIDKRKSVERNDELEQGKSKSPDYGCNGARQYGGRLQKMISLASGVATSRFSHHLSRIKGVNSARVSGQAAFDARIFEVDTDENVVENINWRAADSQRNSRMLFARSFFSHDELRGVPSSIAVQRALDEHNADYYGPDVPSWFRRGVLIKSVLTFKRGYNPKTNEYSENVERSVPSVIDYEHLGDAPSKTLESVLLSRKISTHEHGSDVVDYFEPLDNVFMMQRVNE